MIQKKIIISSLAILLLITIFPITSSHHMDNLEEHYNQTTSTVDILLYTAIQEWPSKSWIYLLNMDGTPITYFEYDWYLFSDVEVVQNQLYTTDWIAPCLYKVNLTDGALEQVISDLSLLYMYDVAFDGTYFYIDEWNLNRYDINGNKDSTIAFNEEVRGSTWDANYYWTLLDSTQIKCWDIQNWPTINEIPANTFSPPTSYCRGLWFDGLYFWTAESIEGTTGTIYQFDYNGTIIKQIPEPIPQGYAACTVNINDEPPHIPNTPTGPTIGSPGQEYTYETSTSDPEGHNIFYQWKWDNNTLSSWLGPYTSGIPTQNSHIWEEPGTYDIQVKAKDVYGAKSSWSQPLTITIQNQPPNPPSITGRINGSAGTSYSYTFISTDPKEDEVSYYIEWGDGEITDWTTFQVSGPPGYSESHIWNIEDSYSIRAKANGTSGMESDWATLDISMPLNQGTYVISLPQRILELFPNAFPILRRILGL